MVDFAVTIFGLIIGSFLTVCIYRIPLGRESGISELSEEQEGEENAEVNSQNSPYFSKKVTILYPRRSFCPCCGIQLKWYHNIPVLGWLIQMGRCCGCKTRISLRYPTVEILTALAAWGSYTLFPPLTAAIAFIFTATLIVISFIDIDYFIIPNVITYPAFILSLLFSLQQHFYQLVLSPPFTANLYESGFGILAGAGVLLFISVFYTVIRKKQGLGMGDVKLLAVTGALFGPMGALFTIFVGSLLGSIIGVSLVMIGKGKWSNYLPFGPYLATANLMYLYISPAFFTDLAELYAKGGVGG